MGFSGEVPLVPFEITAEWLFARTEYRNARCRIRKNFLYVRDKEEHCGWQKYRVIERCPTRYAIRIVALKPTVEKRVFA